MRDPGLNTRTVYAPGLTLDDPAPPAPGDALTDPAVEDLLPGAMALYPRGPAWGTPDGQAPSLDTVLAGLMRVFLVPFADLYRRAWGLTGEPRAVTLVDSLSDWERDYGLPDACSPFDQSLAGRKAALLSKVRSTATITPQDFVQLARQAGYRIEIEEPASFECGFSECGGEHTPGDDLQHVYWIVHVYDLAVDYFVIGESTLGEDRLFAVGDADGLECLFADIAPGWTMPVFVYHDA